MKIGRRKWNFFGVKEIFRINFHFNNECKNEFTDNNENHDADLEKGFLTKSISKPYGCSTAMPPAWEVWLIFLYEAWNFSEKIGNSFFRALATDFETLALILMISAHF